MKYVLKQAKRFKRSLPHFDLTSVERHARQIGWDIEYFDTSNRFIHDFKLAEYAAAHKAFAYKNDTMSVICINSKCTEFEKLFLLLHELAHIKLGHDLKCTSLTEEREANIFAETCLSRHIPLLPHCTFCIRNRIII